MVQAPPSLFSDPPPELNVADGIQETERFRARGAAWSLDMSSSRQLMNKSWRCILHSRHFVGVPRLRLREESVCCEFHNREYGTGNGKLGSKDGKNDGRNVESGFIKLKGFVASGHGNFECGGQFGRSHRSQSQNHGGRGRKPKKNRLSVNGGRGGFRGGFRIPDFDPGNDQLKKIFESQMDSSDPIGELDLGEVGPIEGNFRDDDDSEAEDFYKDP